MTDQPSSQPRGRHVWLRRREITLPTWRGWLLLIALAGLLGITGCRTIQPFLAVTKPVSGGPLVVEGWLADYALRAALDEFRRGGYEELVTTGLPLERGAPLSEHRTYAELGAAVLVAQGANTNTLRAVPAPDVRQDRTYASAMALRDKFAEEGRAVRSLNVVSVGAHARRTRLLYQLAFGPEVAVGIIAVPDREYDPDRWWASSAGVRDVVDETIGYFYARLVFRPAQTAPAGSP